MGIYLKQLREEANFSIREAAKKSGISPSYLFKIESGKSFSTLSIHSIIKLSQTYNIPITALLKEAGFLKDDEYNLPEFSQYLLAKYNLTPQAIQDMEIAKEIVEKKYKQWSLPWLEVQGLPGNFLEAEPTHQTSQTGLVRG